MVAEEAVLDRLYGMISKEQATKVSSGEFGNPDILLKEEGEPFSAAQLCSISEKEWAQIRQRGPSFRISVKDHVYRIFNSSIRGAETERKIILGKEGKTVIVNLRGRVAQAIDLAPLQRGDIVLLKFVLVGSEAHTIESAPNTLLEKVKATNLAIVSDYSLVQGEMKSVDIVGALVEVGEIKVVKSMFSSQRVEVCEGLLSDAKSSARISFWGSSAGATKDIAVGSLIKIEFATVRRVGDAIFVSAADSSRVCKYKKQS